VVNGLKIQLVQDDEKFNSALVSFGTMGIIYSVTLRVCPKFRIEEHRRLIDWKSIKLSLKSGDIFENFDHVEIYVNPYTEDTLLTQRKRVAATTPKKNTLLHSLQFDLLNILDPKVLTFSLKIFPKLIPKFLTDAMQTQDTSKCGPRIDDSEQIFLLGVNGDYGYACEVGFPYGTGEAANMVINTVEKIKENAKKVTQDGLWYTSPVSLRFVRQCDAYMSMMNKGDTCMIENPVITGTSKGTQLMEIVEEMLLKLDGVTHWGLEFDKFVPEGHKAIEERFPNFLKWYKYYQIWNAGQVFSNKATERLQLDFKQQGLVSSNLLEAVEEKEVAQKTGKRKAPMSSQDQPPAKIQRIKE